MYFYYHYYRTTLKKRLGLVPSSIRTTCQQWLDVVSSSTHITCQQWLGSVPISTHITCQQWLGLVSSSTHEKWKGVGGYMWAALYDTHTHTHPHTYIYILGKENKIYCCEKQWETITDLKWNTYQEVYEMLPISYGNHATKRVFWKKIVWNV